MCMMNVTLKIVVCSYGSFWCEYTHYIWNACTHPHRHRQTHTTHFMSPTQTQTHTHTTHFVVTCIDTDKHTQLILLWHASSIFDISLLIHDVEPVIIETDFAHCNTLQHTATHCNTLQRTATHCNTLQHIATHCIKQLCIMAGYYFANFAADGAGRSCSAGRECQS